jgi:transposase
MATTAMTLVGLDVHARQTHAAILDPDGGELRVSRLRMPATEVAALLQGLGPRTLAVYEAGPTGFGLARAAAERGVEVRVVAPGSIPKGSGDRVKTDRRDAIRLVRLLAAGELGFAFVPSVADEQFRDLVRAIEDARGDLMRARHRLSKFLLRRAERYPGPGGAWTAKHMAWLRALRFDEACSQATLVDYVAAVELLIGRRASLITTLQSAIPDSGHADVIARLRCFGGIDTLSAAGLCAEIGSFARFPKPRAAVGLPRRRALRTDIRYQAPPGPDHQGRTRSCPPPARRGRPPLPPPAAHRPNARRPPARPGPAHHRNRLARPAPPAPALGAPAPSAPQALRRRRDRLRARARRLLLGGRHA